MAELHDCHANSLNLVMLQCLRNGCVEVVLFLDQACTDLLDLDKIIIKLCGETTQNYNYHLHILP